jgi:hypothetical protein
MRAAIPYIDDFVPAGTVASLERLGEILAGIRSSDTPRGGEAAAGADAGSRHSSMAIFADPPAVILPSSDPSAARPIR